MVADPVGHRHRPEEATFFVEHVGGERLYPARALIEPVVVGRIVVAVVLAAAGHLADHPEPSVDGRNDVLVGALLRRNLAPEPHPALAGGGAPQRGEAADVPIALAGDDGGGCPVLGDHHGGAIAAHYLEPIGVGSSRNHRAVRSNLGDDTGPERHPHRRSPVGPDAEEPRHALELVAGSLDQRRRRMIGEIDRCVLIAGRVMAMGADRDQAFGVGEDVFLQRVG